MLTGGARGYRLRMTESNQSLRGFGLIGLVGGVLATIGGQLTGSELGALASGYGVLVIVAAGYLLVGMQVKSALQRRHAAAHSTSAAGTTSRI
jgi:hypothetical protein